MAVEEDVLKYCIILGLSLPVVREVRLFIWLGLLSVSAAVQRA